MISKIGKKMSELSGVRKIMNDIILTLENTDKKIINMSAGNPLVFNELNKLWKKHSQIVIDGEEFGEVIGRYGSTKGYFPFLSNFKDFYNSEFNQKITEENILVTTGSQSIFFYAINIFAGDMGDGITKKVFLPQSPDYTGYNSMGLNDNMFISTTPKAKKIGSHEYKYKLNFEDFPDIDEVGAIIFSRPCNPTGNVLLDEEVKQILKYVEGTDIPVFIDSAYAAPIPNLVFKEITNIVSKNVVFTFSFSKAGIPGERIGVAVGEKDTIKYLESFHANLSIMSSRFGQAVISSALSSGDLKEVSNDIIKPKYEDKFKLINKYLSKYMPDDISWFKHKIEGAMFCFLWFENLPISDQELYELLKLEGVLFVPGNTFFNGINKGKIKHSRECLRLSITVEDSEIKDAIKILSSVIRKVYS